MTDYRCILNKRNLARSFLLISFFIFSSCNETKKDKREPSSSGGQIKDIDPSSDSICFDGNSDDGKICFFAILKEDVLREAAGYDYLNPHTDPTFPSRWDPSFYEMPLRFVDLDRENPDTFIAENFKLIEFMEARKGRFGHFSPYVTRVLQEMRSQTNRSIRVNSAYRSPAYNAGISGSAKWSRHQFGDAVDLNISGLTVKEMGDVCADFNADFVLRYKTHIHCDWRWTAKLEDNPAQSGLALRSVTTLTKNHINSLSATTQIVLSDTPFLEGDSVTLSIQSEHGEDHGELLNDWEILTPSGKNLNSSSTSLELTSLEAGTYFVKALAGGLIKVERSFEVE